MYLSAPTSSKRIHEGNLCGEILQSFTHKILILHFKIFFPPWSKLDHVVLEQLWVNDSLNVGFEYFFFFLLVETRWTGVFF